jgi:DNA replication and repair protein RecF
MIIKNLSFQNFRSFQKQELEFSSDITIIVGENTAGKTNTLEAINLLSTGKSFHASLEVEMVKNGEDVGRVVGEIEGQDGDEKLEVVLTRGIINGAKVPRKKFLINGTPKSYTSFVGTFKTILFGPWDMDLVSRSPSLRRKFLDFICSQVDREYRRCLLSYEKGLRHRNRILQKIREGEARTSQLLFWNTLLIKNGEYITKLREEFISFVNMTPPLNDEELKLEYDKSVISPARLDDYANEEVAAGTTLVGPHRDDFEFLAKKKDEDWRNLAAFGSRGEQRMGILWLKLAELNFIEGKTSQKPTLLLDDVFSELDHRHREVVMRVIDKQQTIMTTADPHTIEELNLPEEKVKIINL